METDVAMLDDPPGKDESSNDTEKDVAEASNDDKEPPLKETFEQLPYGQCSYQSDQDEVFAAEEVVIDDCQPGGKASKKSPWKMQQGAIFSGKILSFCCSECKTDTTYSPNDLLKHFQERHKGTLPTYPCDLCTFVTNEFSSFQRHRIVHRAPQVTCEICNDGVQYSLLLLTRHYILSHSQNGHFNCEKCEFSTRDAGTFVQHIHHHNEGRNACVECQYVSPSKRELQRHVSGHSATFPFTCHFCGYGAARKDYLTKHMATAHCEEKARCKTEDKPCVTSPTGLKLLLKKGPVAGGSREPQWMSKLNNLPGAGLLDQNGRFYNPEKALEETQQFLERAVRVKKENSLRLNSAVKTEPQCSYPSSPTIPHPKPPETDTSPGSAPLSPNNNNNNGLTVLMVKNKISIPPNCTTKVMGFKIVDGKKHLVLKVIPTKQESCESPSEGSTTIKEVDSTKYAEFSDDGDKSHSPCSLMSSPAALPPSDAVESGTSGTLNDLAKAMKVIDSDNDIIDVLPMEIESAGDEEQNGNCGKANHTLQQENGSPTSQCEIPASLLTKERKTTVQQSMGDTHAEKRLSFDSPRKSTAEVLRLDKSLDSSVNATPTAHSKASLSDSSTEGNTPLKALMDSSATSHSIAKVTTPDPVANALSDSPEDLTMPSHLTKNDLSPSKSIEVSAMQSPQLSSVTNTPADEITDRVPCSSPAADEPTPPNSDLIPSDVTLHETIPSNSPQVKGAFSDLAEVEDTKGSGEDEITSNDLGEVSQRPPESACNASCSDLDRSSTLSESHEEMEVVNSLVSHPRPSETVSDISQSVNSMENNSAASDSDDNRDVPVSSSECATSDLNENPLLESPENKDRSENMEIPLNFVDHKNTPSSSNEVSNLPLHSIEGEDSHSNCKSPSDKTNTDNTRHIDMPDLTSATSTRMKTRSSHRVITTLSNKAKSVPVNARTAGVDVTDIKHAAQTSKTVSTLPSIVERLRNAALSATAIKPSSTLDTDVVSDSTKDDIDAVNGSPVFDTEPVALKIAHNKPTLLPPTDNANCVVEKPTSPKCSLTTNLALSDCAMSCPVPIPKDSSDSEMCPNVNKRNPLGSGGPLKARGKSDSTPPSHAKDTQAKSPEGNCRVHSNHVTEKQSSITPQNHHSANTRTIPKPFQLPSAQHTPSAKDLSVQKRPVPPAVAETDTVLIDSDSEESSSALNSPTQEVFSFHNYSKETSSSFPDSVLSSEQSAGQAHDTEEVDEVEDCGDFSADWRLTLDASPTPPQASCCEEEEADKCKTEVQSLDDDDPPNTSATSLERVSDRDIEVDDCIAAIDETSHAVEKQTNVQNAPSSSCKDKEDAASVGHKGPGVKNNVAVLGRILEKHSDAIINHQLEKERLVTPVGPASHVAPVAYESVKRTKTTLKILQTSEGKQQMFLQTPDNQYTPVKLASGPGFKLITKSSSSKINVSYVQPGIERPSKATGLALTVGKPGVGLQASSSGDKAPMPFSALQLGTTSSGGRYLVNTASLKRPILLSGAVKSPTGDQTTTRPQTCYLLQRPLPVVPGTSGHESGSQPLQKSRPVLAMPVQQTDKTSPLQTGRQAYLVRYLSPAEKSGVLFGNAEGKAAGSNTLLNESGKSRVFLKVVRSANGTRFLSGVPGSLGKKPIYFATGGALQSPCFVMSSNNSVGYVPAGLKASSLQHVPSGQQPATLAQFFETQVPQVTVPEADLITHKAPHHVSNQTRRKRKKHRKALLDDMSESSSKARRLSGRTEREEPKEWAPASKDVERTLRLSPFSAFQHIKYPRQNQPVVVLNHPDADIPEVVGIMKSVNKFKGEVLKVALSERTVQALSELDLPPGDPELRPNAAKTFTPHGSMRARILGGNVRERFILNLKLKKTSRNKYEVVRKSSSSSSAEQSPTFSCWFCGRIFNNQEDWIGHGQRHLMEATRDWNKLF
ncbi:mucin-2 [Engraulis encrasicolus]|uniref:mucin-2 n=1 Tax=Engraulis encrasicolus TaxID=184585 RepID=UPI002FCEE848